VVTPTGGQSITITATYVAATADQTITFAALPDRGLADPPLVLTASASSGLPIMFTLVSGPATLTGATVTPTGAGTVTIRASQPGNADYNPAPEVERSFTVAKAAQTLSFGPLANKTVLDAAFSVSATATSGL